MKELVNYVKLTDSLVAIHLKNGRYDSEEEDALLEQMDGVWVKMNDEERWIVNTLCFSVRV